MLFSPLLVTDARTSGPLTQLTSIRNVERIPKQALTPGYSMVIEFEDINRETGERFNEVVGFPKARNPSAPRAAACDISRAVANPRVCPPNSLRNRTWNDSFGT